MEDTLIQSQQCLKQIVNERLSTPPDEFVHPCLAGNYSLKPEDVKGEVCDWVLNYLEQSNCPHELAVFIASKVAHQISASVIEKLSVQNKDVHDPYPTVKASSVHSDTLEYLHNLCCHFLEKPDEMVPFKQEKNLPFSSSVFAIKNKRRKMEDRHVVIHDLNTLLNLENLPSHSYYAVFDGHAGIDAASFAAAHLHEDLTKHPEFITDTVKAIKESYKLTDAHFCERAIFEGIKSGCTVVTALIRENTLYLAWLGDSQAVLIKQGKPVTLMNPHKPDRPDERKRIEDLGGFVCLVGTWRVNGALAVARALGDHEFKPYVSSDPDVNVIPLDGTEDFLVLACDGLWDGMSPEEVAAVLYRNVLNHPEEDDEASVKTLAEKLVHQSKLQGSDDNITVIVVLLRDISKIRANAAAYESSALYMNGKYMDYSNDLMTQLHDDEPQNHVTERPKDLHDLVSFPSLNAAYSDGLGSNPDHGMATSLPPEATALSELPTPPIDDIVITKQFSELTVTEQMEQLQSHLETSGFQGTSFGEYSNIPGGINQNQSEQLSSMDPQDLYATEISSNTVFPVSELSVKEVTPEEAAMNIASNIVSNTLESAMQQVDLAQSIASPSEPCSQLNPNAEPFVMKNFSPQQPVSDFGDICSKSPNSLQPPVSPESNPFTTNDDADTTVQPMIFDLSLDSESQNLSPSKVDNAVLSFQNQNTAVPSPDKLEAISASDNVLQMSEELLTTQFVQELPPSVENVPENVPEVPVSVPADIVLNPVSVEAFEENASLKDAEKILEKHPPVNESDQIEAKEDTGLNAQGGADQLQVDQLATNISEIRVGDESSICQEDSSLIPEQLVETKEEIICQEDSSLIPEQLVETKEEKKSDSDTNVSQDNEPKDQPNESENFVILESEIVVKDTLASGDVSEQINSKNVTSPSKPVIGVDSLLPKEVQDELLKVAENPPSETVAEDSQTNAVAVDLKSVPDGVPEAEGVSEDIDSDSEKDGGWSYVKANEDVTAKKELSDSKSSAVKEKKNTDEKPIPPALTKSKKEAAKPVKDAPVKKVSNLLDKTKKPPMEKKVVESKTSTSAVRPATMATKQVAAVKPTKPLPSAPKRNLLQKTTSDSTTKPPTAVRSTTKTQTSVTKTLIKTTVSASASRPTQKTTASTVSASSFKSSVRPASAAAGLAQSKDPAAASTKQTTQPRLPVRPTSAPAVNKTTSRPLPSKPSSGVPSESKASALRKPLSVPKKTEGKEEKDNANKQIMAKKLPMSIAQKPPLSASTPKPNSVSKVVTQSRITKASVPPKSAHFVSEPSKQHVGLKAPKTVPKANTNRFAKTKKDTSTGKKPIELTAKSTNNDTKPKENEAKEKFALEVNAKESEPIPSVESVETKNATVMAEIKDEIKPNEIITDPVSVENAEIIL